MSDVRNEILGIAQDAPPNPYSYARTYLVRTVHTDGRMDLDPPPDAKGSLSSLPNVEQWTMGGALSFPPAGTPVLVLFRDARQERPVVIGIAPTTPPGPDAARSGDLVVRYWIVQGSGGNIASVWLSPSTSAPFSWTAVPIGLAPPSPTDPGVPITISAGSALVKIAP